MQAFWLMLFVQSLPPLMQRFMLSVYGRGVRFEREQMRLELFEIVAVTRGVELRAMELLELLDEFGVSRFELLLRFGEPISVWLRWRCHTHASYSATEASVSRNPGHRSTGSRGYLGNVVSTSDNPQR